MTKKAAVKVVQPQPPAEQIPAEIIATSIVEISEGMRKLNETRLKRDAIVTLIARSSNVARSTIEVVLNNLEELERTWLKPAKTAAKVLVLALIVSSVSGCSPYAVRKYSPAADKATLSSRGTPLVSSSKAGIEWHQKPNDVVVELMRYFQDVAKEQAGLRAELENVRDNLAKCKVEQEATRHELPVDAR